MTSSDPSAPGVPWGDPRGGRPGDGGPPPGYGGPPPGYGGPPPGYGGPPVAYGYGNPPPAYNTHLAPGGYPPVGPGGYPPGWGAPPVPPGFVAIPGGPLLRAATPGQRALARLIDSVGYLILLVGGIAVVVAIVAHVAHSQVDYSYGYATPRTDEFPVEILWIYAVPIGLALVVIAYEALTIGLTGSTLGGRLVGVRFVRTRDGATPGLGRALGRAAMLGASIAVCYGVVFLLLLLSMFFDNQPGRYRSWIDTLCGLQAVSTKG